MVNVMHICLGQHRSDALEQLYSELGDKFCTEVSVKFTIGVYDCMPKAVANFVCKVFLDIMQPLQFLNGSVILLR